HGNLGQVVTLWENIFHHLRIRSTIVQQHGRGTLYLCRITEVEAFEYRVQNMTSHITQCTCTEIPPTAPVPGMINIIERTVVGRPNKEIPFQSGWYAISFLGSHQTLRPDRSVGKCFHFGYFTNLAVGNPINHLSHTGS